MSEMVDETMDQLDEDAEELDDEAEAEVDKVLFEITNGKMGDMSKVGQIPVSLRLIPTALVDALIIDFRVRRQHRLRKKRRIQRSCADSWMRC